MRCTEVYEDENNKRVLTKALSRIYGWMDVKLCLENKLEDDHHLIKYAFSKI